MRQPYTFENGLTVEKGSYIGIPTGAVQVDGNYYEDPQTFNPYRFYSAHDVFEPVKHGFVSISDTYFPFGHGHHIWYVHMLISGGTC